MEPACPAGLPPLSVGVAPRIAQGLAGDAFPKASPRSIFDTIREDDVWDTSEDEIEEIGLGGTIRRPPKFPPTPLSCSRGPSGGLAGLAAPEGLLLRTSTFDETLCSKDAVRGKERTWVRGETVGRGSMGLVFQAMDQASGKVIAVKELAIDPNNDADMKFKDQLENEIRICKDLSHPRIVSYLGDDFINGSLFIYLEYMAGGSMTSVLRQFGAFEESLVALYTRALLEGLEYLHTREPPVVHRDIKSGNVLVGLDTRVKLADFGCSKRQQETMSHTIKGSIPWMAPEVITNTGYGRRADIWSFGCVMIEMATASPPWGKFDNPMAAMMKIGMSKELPPIPAGLSAECQDFIGKCVQRNKELRPPATELLQHEFICDLLLDDH